MPFIDRVKRKREGIRYEVLCKSCKKECDDIQKHLMTVHKFSKEIIESQLKSNPNSYKSAFEKLEK